jgi:hypothetical protein
MGGMEWVMSRTGWGVMGGKRTGQGLGWVGLEYDDGRIRYRVRKSICILGKIFNLRLTILDVV